MNAIIVILLIILLAMVIYITAGTGYKFRKEKADRKRIEIEDALKYIYNCEYDGDPCNIEGIAGNLGIKTDKASEIVNILQSRGLIGGEIKDISLSAEGRIHALRIIRTHRLLEQYFAEETSLPETSWHQEAEKMEHHVNSEELERIAAKIGNPVRDPHGDPIPTSTGRMFEKKGVSLTESEEGSFARIVHIEDEPPVVYSQLVAFGLFPGIEIQILEKSANRIIIIANDEEIILANILAANITVKKIEKIKKPKYSRVLSELNKGEKGIIAGISRSCRGRQRRRLMDLGIVPGAEIKAELASVSGDPVAYNIRNTLIALRKDQSSKIFINEEGAKNG